MSTIDHHERTSTGYRRAGEREELRRMTFYLTSSQRRELMRRMAEMEETSVSSYLIEVLNLPRVAVTPFYQDDE